MEQALEHERSVTAAINDLFDMARDVNDYASEVMLEWFIEEQVEEEKTVEEIVDQLRMVGKDGTGLLIIDARLGERSPEDESDE